MSDKPMLHLYYEPYSTIAGEAVADGKVYDWLDEKLEQFRYVVASRCERYFQIYFSTDNVFGHLIQAVADGRITRDEFELIRNGTAFVMNEYGTFVQKETGFPLDSYTSDYRPSAVYMDAHAALLGIRKGRTADANT